MRLSHEELSDMTRSSVDPVGLGPVTRPFDNSDLPEGELRRRILQRNAARKPTYLLRLEYKHRLNIHEAQSRYIFISYKREDLSRMAEIICNMISWGYPVWYDREIPGGAEWSALIEEKILGCKMLVACLSDVAVNSKWVRREIKFADSENRPILGIRLDDNVELKEGLKIILDQYQMLDVSRADFSGALEKAIKHLWHR